MTRLGRDWKVLRNSVLTLAGAIFISASIVYFSARHADHAQKNWRLAQQNLALAQAALNTVNQQQADIARYLPVYQHAKLEHLIGVEPRLTWIENLATLQQQNIVPQFSYQIAAQTPYPAERTLDTGKFVLHYSAMKLSFELHHEGELLTFFKVLPKQVKGWYELQGCLITRNLAERVVPLKAECTGGWVTLQEAGGSP
jgi:hypothetical protein